jgi:hypothetical protein
VLTYVPTPDHLDELGREFIEVTSTVAAARGEPMDTVMTPAAAEAIVEGDCGLRVAEHLSRDDLHARYFVGRSDALTPPTSQRVITAFVPA